MLIFQLKWLRMINLFLIIKNNKTNNKIKTIDLTLTILIGQEKADILIIRIRLTKIVFLLSKILVKEIFI